MKINNKEKKYVVLSIILNIISFCRNLATTVQHCKIWYKGSELVLQTLWDQILAGAGRTRGFRQPRQICGPRRFTQRSVCYWTLLGAQTFGFVSFYLYAFLQDINVFHSKDFKTCCNREKDRKTAILKYKKKNYFPYTKYQLYLIFSSSSLHSDSTSDDDVIRYRILEKGSKRGGRLLVASTGYTYGLKVVTLWGQNCIISLQYYTVH